MPNRRNELQMLQNVLPPLHSRSVPLCLIRQFIGQRQSWLGARLLPHRAEHATLEPVRHNKAEKVCDDITGHSDSQWSHEPSG